MLCLCKTSPVAATSVAAPAAPHSQASAFEREGLNGRLVDAEKLSATNHDLYELSESSANKLREQIDGMLQRMGDMEAEDAAVQERLRQAEEDQREVQRLREEAAELRRELEDGRAHEVALGVSLKRQQELEDELDRVKVELQGRDKALARVQESLGEQMVKADALNEKHQVSAARSRRTPPLSPTRSTS